MLLKLMNAGWQRPDDSALGPWNLELDRGCWAVLAGASGSGKTSLLHRILGSPPHRWTPTGQLVWRDRPFQPTPAEHRHWLQHEVGLVPQDAQSALSPTRTIGSQLQTLLPGTSLWHTLCKELGLDTLSRLHQRFPHELSGGERQRILLAFAIAKQPALLLLDEPSSALHPEITQQLPLLVQQYAPQAACVWIVHDQHLLNQLPPPITWEHAAAAAVPSTLPRFHAPSPYLVQLDQVSVVYHQRPLFAPLSGVIPRAGIVGLQAPSGAGKSSLLQAIQRITLGQEHPLVGTLQTQAGTLPSTQLVLQNPYATFTPHLSVWEQLWEVAPQSSDTLGAYTERLGLPRELLQRYPHQLSGGQLQRAAIVRACMARPDWLLLDEPHSALDPQAAYTLSAWLQQIAEEEQIAMLVVSHDPSWLAQTTDTVWSLTPYA